VAEASGQADAAAELGTTIEELVELLHALIESLGIEAE